MSVYMHVTIATRIVHRSLCESINESALLIADAASARRRITASIDNLLLISV